jgi:hypothetical protein
MRFRFAAVILQHPRCPFFLYHFSNRRGNIMQPDGRSRKEAARRPSHDSMLNYLENEAAKQRSLNQKENLRDNMSQSRSQSRATIFLSLVICIASIVICIVESTSSSSSQFEALLISAAVLQVCGCCLHLCLTRSHLSLHVLGGGFCFADASIHSHVGGRLLHEGDRVDIQLGAHSGDYVDNHCLLYQSDIGCNRPKKNFS